MKRFLAVALMAGVMSGCSSLRFKSTEDVRSMSEEAFSNQNYEDAEVYTTELLRRDEADARARLLRARSRDLSNTGTVQAREDYNVLVEQRPDDGRVRLYRAELNMRQGNIEAAQEDLNALSERTDLDASVRVAAWNFRGVIQLKKNNLSFAAMALRQAVSAGAGSSDPLVVRPLAEAHHNLGHALFLMNNFQEAHTHFKRHESLAPQAGLSVGPDDYYNLAITAYLSGRYSVARSYFAKSDPQLRAKAAKILDDPGINNKNFH